MRSPLSLLGTLPVLAVAFISAIQLTPPVSAEEAPVTPLVEPQPEETTPVEPIPQPEAVAEETPTPPVEPETPPAPEPTPEPVVTPEATPETPVEAAPEEEVVSEGEAVSPLEQEAESYAADYERYKKYLLYQKYEHRVLYQKYERYTSAARRAVYFENRKKEKKYLSSLKKKYKKYAKSPAKNARYAGDASEYLSYGTDKANYLSLKPFANYGYLARFNRPEYDAYAQYGAEEYKAGYERYLTLLKEGKVTDRGDADLEAEELGPEIRVGIFNYIPKDLKDSAFKIKADKPFTIIHRDGTKIADIAAGKSVRVKYLGDKRFRAYDPETDETYTETSKEIRFEAEDLNAVFDVSRPASSFDRYRGDIKLRYYDSPESDGDRIWVINTLPLEHYVYGMGEITGTGPDEYDKVMTTIFRTYGYWKLKWSTKYADQGFKVDATSGNQIYYGYDWEITHPDIPRAADATRGTLVMYDREVALTPYSSWSDGKTRRFEDGHWGRACKSESKKTSELYPWLSAVSDTDGKHASESTCSLAAKGNHMVGLSANGAVRRAKNSNAAWDAILEHYYTGIDLIRAY